MENYTTSEKIKSAHAALRAAPQVQQALEFLVDDNDHRVEEQVAIAMVPAPTFQETERAKAICKYFTDLGLTDVHIDRFGNAMGTRKGTGNGPRVLLEAHMDTVFPMETVLEPKYEGSKIYLPGVNDNCSGCAVLLSVIRGLNSADIQTEGDLVFVATVEEEGKGALGGMRKLFTENKFDASISIDSAGFGDIAYQGLAIRTTAITFHGQDGHAAGSFGKVANALNAAARAVANIAEIRVPSDPNTIFCVSNFHAGTDEAINAVAPEVVIKMNYRSLEQWALEELHQNIIAAVDKACEDEAARWGEGVQKVTWDMEMITDIKVVEQNVHNPIVESMYEILKGMGVEEPPLRSGAACNLMMAVAAGTQAICTGAGGSGTLHSLDEYYDPGEKAYESPQAVLLLALMMAGAKGIIEPQA